MQCGTAAFCFQGQSQSQSQLPFLTLNPILSNALRLPSPPSSPPKPQFCQCPLSPFFLPANSPSLKALPPALQIDQDALGNIFRPSTTLLHGILLLGLILGHDRPRRLQNPGNQPRVHICHRIPNLRRTRIPRTPHDLKVPVHLPRPALGELIPLPRCPWSLWFDWRNTTRCCGCFTDAGFLASARVKMRGLAHFPTRQSTAWPHVLARGLACDPRVIKSIQMCQLMALNAVNGILGVENGGYSRMAGEGTLVPTPHFLPAWHITAPINCLPVSRY